MNPEKLPLQSADGAQINLDMLYQIAPSCFTEARGADGKVRRVVNFDVLRQLLGDSAADTGEEFYQFTWPGKAEARREAARSIRKTLRPVPEDSVDWDTTQNIYIEGDNLEVLKLLQKSYMGKVKMIYIDPPYNTGNDFVYNDDFAATAADHDRAEGNTDELGNRYRKNTDSNGRFHSDWCSMIYSRLQLARNLLTEDGAIFISIDDNESTNLKKICDEIFGADNFINNISIKMSELSGVKMKYIKKFAKLKETLLIYAKDEKKLNLLIEKKKKSVENLTKYLRYYSSIIINPTESCENWIIKPISEVIPNYSSLSADEIENWKMNNASNMVYRTNSKTVDAYMQQNPSAPSICRFTNADGNDVVKWDNKEMLFLDKYISEYMGDIWMDISTINLNKECESITFANGQKPLALLLRLLKCNAKTGDVILDFFSGSSTTAHAAFIYAAQQGINTHFIMVQLPENLEDNLKYASGEEKRNIEESIEFLKGINKPLFIPELAKERIRRAGRKIKEEAGLQGQDLDIGFRVFRVDESNMEDVYFQPAALRQQDLTSLFDNVKPDRTHLDLLFGAMLDWGVQLSLPMSKATIDGRDVYTVNEGDLVACFAENITENVIAHIADQSPLRVLFRDSCFNTDADKINIFEQFKQRLNWSDEEAMKNIRVI